MEDSLTASLVTGPGNGTLTAQTDGSGNVTGWSYTPPDDYTGEVTLTYDVTDGYATTTQTVRIAVTATPTTHKWIVAQDDEVTWPLSGFGASGYYNDVKVNDGYSTGDTLEFSLISGTGLTLNTDGSFTYTPADPLQFAQDADGETFSYEAKLIDSQTSAVLATDQATLTIIPLVLEAGQSYSSGHITVSNPVSYNDTTGVNDITIWFVGDTVHILGGSADGHYAVDVIDTDTDANTDADVIWYGGAGSLRLNVDGDIRFDKLAGSFVGGDFVLNADKDISFNAVSDSALLTTKTLIAISDSGEISDVSTTDQLIQVNAFGDVGDVTSAKTAHVITSATGDIGAVSVTDGDLWFVEASAGTVGNITVTTGHLGAMHVGGNYNSTVNVTGDIGSVFVDGDLLGTAAINATGDIGAWRLDDLSSVYFYNYHYYYFETPGGPSAAVQTMIDTSPLGDLDLADFSGVFVGGRIDGTVTSTTGAIGVVYADDDVTGAVSAKTSLLFVGSNTGSLTGNITATDNNIGLLQADVDITGSITAGQNLLLAKADRDITGDITAGQSIGSVHAGRHLSGNLAATFGSIDYITAATKPDGSSITTGNITSTTITAGQHIGRIRAEANDGFTGDIGAQSTITATAGYIGEVTAGGAIDAVFTAGSFFGLVTALKDVSGSFTAVSSIAGVTSTDETISAAITAGKVIGRVAAKKSVTGSIQGKTVTGITATEVAISGTVTAIAGGTGIGDITAGTDITGAITATAGSIGAVLAGQYSAGDITGNIDAADHIASVAASVTDVSLYSIADAETENDFLAAILAWLDNPEGEFPALEFPIAAPTTEYGNINATIDAGKSIGFVGANGNLTGDVSAGDRLDVLWAMGDVTSDVLSLVGETKVQSTGRFSGSLNTWGDASVHVGGLLEADIVASTGMAHVITGRNLTGDVSGDQGSIVWALGGVANSAISSSSGTASITSLGTVVNTTIDADQTTGINSVGRFDGDLISRSGNVFANALGGIAGNITAHESVLATSLQEIKSDITATQGEALIETKSYSGGITAAKSIHLNVENSLTGSVRSTGGDVFVSAGSIGGDNLSIRSDTGRVGVEVFGGKNADGTDNAGDIQADIAAQKGISIWTKGAVLDNSDGARISSQSGDVTISAIGKIEADIEAFGGGNVSLRTWDVLDGRIAARNGGSSYSPTSSNINLFVNGNILQEIRADGSVSAVTWDNLWGDIIAGGNIGVFTRHDVVADLTAGRHLSVIASGDVIGDLVAGTASSTANASIVADQDVAGTVTASQNVVVDVLGTATAVDIVAKSGDASLSSLGNVTSTTVAAGGDSTVRTGGLLDQVTLLSGRNAVISAHGNISNTTVTARRDASVVGDANLTTTTVKAGVSGNGSAVLGALDDVTSVTVITTLAASIFAGKSINADATAGKGTLNVTALDDISGTYLGKDDANLTAHGRLSDVTVNVIGDVSLYAGASIAGTAASDVTASGRDLDITSLHDFKANLTAEGAATLLVSGHLQKRQGQTGAILTAQEDADVSLRGQVDGDIISQNGSVTVVTQGLQNPGSVGADVTGDITGNIHTKVTNLGGSIQGEVKATLGDALIISAGTVSESVTAGRHINIRASDDVGNGTTSTVLAGGNAYVGTLGTLYTDVTASGGNASVVAGESISGAVTGNLNTLAVTVTGEVNDAIAATIGTVLVVSAGTIHDTVSGGLHAGVFALGAIESTVTATAGNAIAVASGGGIQGPVTAGGAAVLYALDDVQQNVAAGTDVFAVTLGNIAGTVSAGHDAIVSASGNLNAPVTAGRHALVTTVGSINGNITATTGDAYVISFGSVTSTITAGHDTLLLGFGVGDNINATINSGHDAFVETYGWSTLNVTAPNDVYVFTSGGTLKGTVDAGRHAAVIAMGNQTVLTLDAGMDVYVFSFGSLDIAADAGRDIAVIGLDRVKGTVDAVSNSFVYTLNTVTTLSQTAGEFAALIAWDSVQGPSAVNGDDGAFVWTYGSFYGDVTSSTGWAALTAFGDVWLSSVTAETDTYVTAVNNFGIGSDVTAGEGAYIVSFGNFEGVVSAQSDAVLIGEGSFNVDLSAGKDVYVYSLGDVQGRYNAGRDGSIITFSDFHGRLYAGRDVGGEIFGLQMPGVWAKGNINGVIDANRNIGYEDRDTVALFDATKYPPIFAGGTINADLYARNTSHDPKGGKIGRVGAHGEINGLFKATNAIDEVFSSDDIFAVLDAPQSKATRSNDSNVLTDHPLPATPASVKADVLSGVADAYSDVLTDTDAIALADGDLLEFMRDFNAEMSDDIAVARTERNEYVTSSQASAQEALATTTQIVNNNLQQHRQDMAADKKQLIAEARRSESDDEKRTLQEQRERTSERSQWIQAAQTQAAATSAADKVIAEEQTRSLSEADLKSNDHQQEFEEIRKQEKKAKEDAIITRAKAFLARGPVGMAEDLGNLALSSHQLLNKLQWQATEYFVREHYLKDPFGLEAARERYNRVATTWNNARDSDAGVFGASIQVVGVIFYDESGAMGLFRAGTGEDPVTLRQYSGEERAAEATNGTLRLGMLAVGGAQGLHKARTSNLAAKFKTFGKSLTSSFTSFFGKGKNKKGCKCFGDNVCFIAGTPVVVGLTPEATHLANVAFTEDSAFIDGDLSDAVIAGLAIGVGLVGYRMMRRRKSDLVILENELILPDEPDPGNTKLILPEFEPEPDPPMESVRDAEPEPDLVASASPVDFDLELYDDFLQTVTPTEEPAGMPVITSQKTEHPAMPRKSRMWSRVAMLWLAAWVAIGGWLLTKSHLPSEFTPAAAVAETPAAAPASTLQTRPIEQLRVGRKLPANNPDVANHGSKTAVDPATWKLLKLQAVAVWPDGTRDVHEIETLQPPEWIKKHAAIVGATVPIPLDLVEMGSPEDLTARVLAIERCPPIEDGPGQVILTTVNHLNRFVFRVTVKDASGQSETLGVTGHHKFYSEIRQAWVSAKDLQQGETLGHLQRQVTVAGLERLPGTHRVYNLTVENEHVYYVCGVGVLVHNNCGNTTQGGAHGQTKLPWGDGLESHHMPAKSVIGLHPDAGPAIQMERADHILTSSHGSRSGSAAYRSHIEDLLNQGKVREAMAIEIRDVRRAAFEGSRNTRKYNNAMREMLKYARDIGYVP